MFYSTKQFRGKRKSTVMGSMPVRGVNLRDDPQFLDPSSGLYIYNYYVEGLAKLKKRGGVLLSIEGEDTDEKDVWQEWTDIYDIQAYGTDIKLYNRNTGVYSTISSALTATETHEGARAGDAYFFITNKTDGPQRVKYQMDILFNTDYSGANLVSISGDVLSDITDTYIIGVDSGAVGVIIDKGRDALENNTMIVFTVTSGEFIQGENVRVEISGVDTPKLTRSGFNQFSYYQFGTSTVAEPERNLNAIGQKITGVDSGATAEIVFERENTGDTGYSYVLRDVRGEFIPGEYVVNDTSPDKFFSSIGGNGLLGRGKVVSSGFVVDSLYNNQTEKAPKAGGVSVLGGRIFLYNLAEEQSATAISAIPTGDTTAGGKFYYEIGDDFRDSANFTGGGLISWPEAGPANSCAQIGDIYVTFCTNGFYAWRITPSASGTAVYKSLDSIASRLDLGGQRGAITTPIGLCVANKAGITAIYGLGLTNVPYSKQSKLLTAQIGNEFFQDVDFTDTDMVYDEAREYLYVTCAKNSSTNNLVLAIRSEGSGGSESGAQGAISFFDWPVKRFLKRSTGELFAVFNDGSLHALNVGSDDNGAPIHTEYLQELNFAQNDLFNLEEWFWKGELSPVSSINVSFDIYDKDMYFTQNVKNYTWAAKNSYGAPSGWGSSGWGASGWGGGSSVSGLVEDKDGARPGLRNLSRCRIRFTSDDYADHTINWMSGSVSFVRPDRKRSSPNT